MFSKWTRICLLVVTATFLIIPSLNAELLSLARSEPVLDHAWRADEYPQGSFLFLGDPPVYQEVDVTHYTIDAHFLLGDNYPDSASMEAVTTIDGQAKAEILDELIIDFHEHNTINSLKFNSVEFTNYTRSEHRIWMDLSADPLDPYEVFEIIVDYTHDYTSQPGPPLGLLFRTHGDSNTPGISSVGQPLSFSM